MSKKDGKLKDFGRNQYINTQQTESYRQQLQKESKILQAKTKADIEKLHPYFKVNNNYLALLKTDPEQNNQNAVNTLHPLEQLGQQENEYCQKCTKDRQFCPHKNQQRIEKRTQELQYPVTSTQQIGWRKPIDTTVGHTGYGLKSTIQSFNTNFRSTQKKKE
ncbi:hypothetical protein PPERSA_07302 [Pseudocohnilembus persalinus]|uniref:Uncharacterized protein n=1 Tax=Pseudocohnilembus persalinus TaxID=266149 RepID=A0A0V0Q767_PSEPJ|nr:hypothetical protein PPERSA_07302 [Pseudocohnilembus persalinus]|eukprot:KRW98077.1 hypothetical protein PPERSA_07302 [Pseudocohnilembus persalinus]